MDGDHKARAAAARAQQLAAIPFTRVTVKGAEAWPAWQRLRRERPGTWPVVVGDDEAMTRIGEQLIVAADVDAGKTPDVILATAANLRFPDALAAERGAAEKEGAERLRADLAADRLPTIYAALDGKSEITSWRGDAAAAAPLLDGKSFRRLSTSEVRARLEAQLAEPSGPKLGEWPPMQNASSPLAGQIVGLDIRTGKPLANANILIVPVEEGAAVPAHLRWGGWNACPAPEQHVAALRSWRERYGAELVGVGGDTLLVRVARRPSTRDEALALAREHYLYCPDSVDQGTGTLAPLAAGLMASDWWYFWWD